MDLALFIAACVVLPLFLFLTFKYIINATAHDGDTAPGWIVQCTTCKSWRPASEVGVVRIGAAGTKYTLGRCSPCGKLRFVAIRRGPGEAGQRIIDERTNPELWPETISDADFDRLLGRGAPVHPSD